MLEGASFSLRFLMAPNEIAHRRLMYLYLRKRIGKISGIMLKGFTSAVP